MDNDPNDAKPGADSSTATDDKVAAPSSSEGQQTPPNDEGSQDAFSKAVLAAVPSAAEGAQAASGPTIGQDGKEGQQPPLEPATGKVEGKEPTKQAEGELPPFHEHPRWKQLVSERDNLAAKVQAFEAESKPKVEQYDGIVEYCQANRITPEQYKDGLEFLALFNTNPAEALKKLQPVIAHLQQYDGSALTADLEEAVADGSLSLERAQEIAQLRAAQKAGQAQSKVTETQLQDQRRASTEAALSGWEQTVVKTDPDFKPRANEDDPKGMYEFVLDEFRGRILRKPPTSPQEAVALAQQAYDSVKKALSRFQPKPAERKVLTTTGSARTSAQAPPATLDEVVWQTAAKHGITE